MNTYSFVYSNSPRYRIFRHVLYWLTWIGYFVLINLTYSIYNNIVFSAYFQYTTIAMLILLSVDIMFCYAVLYLLLPKLLLKGKYVLFFTFIVLFLLLDAALSSYLYVWIINPIRIVFKLKPLAYVTFTDLLRGLSGVIMMTAFSVAIRFFKMWNIKKQEISLINSERVTRDFKFAESYNPQPNFLPVLLKRIHSYSLVPTGRVSEMLEKLQQIVAYLIEECNQPVVLLAHEIDSVRNLVQLEKMTNTNRLNIMFEQTGEPGELEIIPFILFPFIESNFRQVNDHITDNHWTSVLIRIESNTVLLLLKNSKPVETSNLLNYETATIGQIRKRLDLVYPGAYKFNIIIEENTFNINLEIDLSRAVN